MARRTYGTGCLFLRNGKWYGQWREAGRSAKRVLGPKRQPGSREGLTAKQAEAELRRRMQESGARPRAQAGAVSFAKAAAEYLRYVEDVRRIDPGTARDYRAVIEGYLLDEFRGLELDVITPALI
ncbi:MAG: hypothetical protein ACREMY_19630, partial [bacterium]